MSGSSPRVRGKLAQAIYQAAPVRLIPACAGKTVPIQSPSLSLPAHPRVCGENSKMRTRKKLALGSSPRVRGKLVDFTPVSGWVRLIPACAGKTHGSSFNRLSPRAHPRVCGENVFLYGFRGGADGSSPRVRGKRGEGG